MAVPLPLTPLRATGARLALPLPSAAIAVVTPRGSRAAAPIAAEASLRLVRMMTPCQGGTLRPHVRVLRTAVVRRPRARGLVRERRSRTSGAGGQPGRAPAGRRTGAPSWAAVAARDAWAGPGRHTGAVRAVARVASRPPVRSPSSSTACPWSSSRLPATHAPRRRAARVTGRSRRRSPACRSRAWRPGPSTCSSGTSGTCWSSWSSSGLRCARRRRRRPVSSSATAAPHVPSGR